MGLFNVEETRITIVPKNTPLVVARKDCNQVGLKSSAERLMLTTVEITDLMTASAPIQVDPVLLTPDWHATNTKNISN